MSWGSRITVVFIAFISLMGFMVWKSCGENIELVSADYYDQEIRYEETMNRHNNYRQLGTMVGFDQDDSSVKLTIPSEEPGAVSIRFLRPSDSRYDYQVQSEITKENVVIVEKEKLVRGLYRVTVKWEKDGKEFQADFPAQIS